MTHETCSSGTENSRDTGAAWSSTGVEFPAATPGTIEHTALTVFGVAVQAQDSRLGTVVDKQGNQVVIIGRAWDTSQAVQVYINRSGEPESLVESVGLVPYGENRFGHLVIVDTKNSGLVYKLVKEARPKPREKKPDAVTKDPNPFAIENTNPDWRNENPGDGRGVVPLAEGVVPASGVAREANRPDSGVYHVGGDRYSHTPPPDQAHM